MQNILQYAIQNIILLFKFQLEKKIELRMKLYYVKKLNRYQMKRFFSISRRIHGVSVIRAVREVGLKIYIRDHNFGHPPVVGEFS